MKVAPTKDELDKLGIQPDQMEHPICRGCITAANIIRRMGFRDNIAWGLLRDAPTKRIHAMHANTGVTVTRTETEDEYKRRLENAPLTGKDQPPEGQKVTERVLQPLCVFYSSELMFLTASQPKRLTVYMAHPVADDFAMNISDATCWLRYLRRVPITELQTIVGAEFEQRPLILAPWLAGIEEDDSYPGGREAIMQDSRDAAMLFDEVWLLGGRVSTGMMIEAAAARRIRDLTHLGTWAKFRPPQTTSRAKLTLRRKR